MDSFHESRGQALGLEKIERQEVINQLEQARSFAKSAMRPIDSTKLLSRCVDGRYTDEQAESAMVAIPGGDLGLLGTALGLIDDTKINLTRSQIKDCVDQICGGFQNLRSHTDESAVARGAECAAGCGHCKHMSSDPSAYMLSQDSVEYLQVVARSLATTGQEVVLPGQHEEEFVVVVESDNFGLIPKVQIDGQETQAFVYSKNQHQQLLGQLADRVVEKCKENGDELEVQDVYQSLENIFDTQLNETLKRLASGKSIFVISIDQDGLIQVDESGVVPSN